MANMAATACRTVQTDRVTRPPQTPIILCCYANNNGDERIMSETRWREVGMSQIMTSQRIRYPPQGYQPFPQAGIEVRMPLYTCVALFTTPKVHYSLFTEKLRSILIPEYVIKIQMKN